jgi:exoribonuclease-2
MQDKGMAVDFPQEVTAELAADADAVKKVTAGLKDLTSMLWCSIDNDDSEDLDQLTVAETQPNGNMRILVSVADVDFIAAKGSAVDIHASLNTLSVYTPAVIFPMLPERLSTDITSLKYGAIRQSLVIEYIIDPDGNVLSGDVYGALVKNWAKLAYNSVAAWLENTGPQPDAVGRVNGLAGNIKLQDAAAQKLRALRYKNGALSFESSETHAVFDDGHISSLEPDKKNRAKDIIEDFMIAANSVTARFLESKKFPSIRRIVHTPKRWERIVELAKSKGFVLPAAPDPKPLEAFLIAEKKADPDRFLDVSLSVIKLLGPGEYCLELPGASSEGHFGLAVKDYTHSTAPNRRYADLITHRLLKAAISGAPVPYTTAELDELAKHCTQKENDAKKVERQLSKSAAALLLQSMIGNEFDAIITGASDKGTWARIFDPPVEGRMNGDMKGLDVGDKVRVKLKSVNADMGFIDFIKA